MMRDLNQVSGEIVDTAYRLHSRLGPGLLESVYEWILAHMLEKRGLRVERQKAIPFEWDGVRIEEACRVDLLVEGQVVVELKSLEKLHPVHQKQVLTYLRLLDQPVGLLINFGAVSLKTGTQRIINHQATTFPLVRDVRGALSGTVRENSVNSVDSV
jgi:iron complex transport system substrate-binding protein